MCMQQASVIVYTFTEGRDIKKMKTNLGLNGCLPLPWMIVVINFQCISIDNENAPYHSLSEIFTSDLLIINKNEFSTQNETQKKKWWSLMRRCVFPSWNTCRDPCWNRENGRQHLLRQHPLRQHLLDLDLLKGRSSRSRFYNGRDVFWLLPFEFDIATTEKLCWFHGGPAEPVKTAQWREAGWRVADETRRRAALENGHVRVGVSEQGICSNVRMGLAESE